MFRLHHSFHLCFVSFLKHSIVFVVQVPICTFFPSPGFWRGTWPLWWKRPSSGSLWRFHCCPDSGGCSPSSPSPQCTALCFPRVLKNKLKKRHRQAEHEDWSRQRKTNYSDLHYKFRKLDDGRQSLTNMWDRLEQQTHKDPCFCGLYDSLPGVMTLGRLKTWIFMSINWFVIGKCLFTITWDIYDPISKMILIISFVQCEKQLSETNVTFYQFDILLERPKKQRDILFTLLLPHVLIWIYI